MTPDPKLVEALARLLKKVEGVGGIWEHIPDYVRDTFLNDARDFIARHRLVSLQEGQTVIEIQETEPFRPTWDYDDD